MAPLVPTVTLSLPGVGDVEPLRVFHQSEDKENVFRKVLFEGCELSGGEYHCVTGDSENCLTLDNIPMPCLPMFDGELTLMC